MQKDVIALRIASGKDSNDELEKTPIALVATVYDLISGLSAYVIFGEKNRPN